MSAKLAGNRHGSTLSVGALFEIERRIVKVTAIDGEVVSAIDLHTREPLGFSATQLLGSVRPYYDLQAVSAEDWERAKKMSKLLIDLIAGGPTSDRRIVELTAKHGIPLKVRAVREVLRRFRNVGTVGSCLRMPPGRKRGARLLPSKTELAIRTAIATTKKKPEMVTFDFLMKEVRNECFLIGCEMPSRNSVKRRAIELGLDLSRRRKYGPEVAENNGTVHAGTHIVDRPLKEIQIDHTLCDIEVYDETGEIFLGRPWLTLCVDVFSRAILGFYLSMKAPSMYAVSRTLLMSVLPKEWLLQRLGIDLPWSTYGKPENILTDNGAEFRSESFVKGCEDNGINPLLRPIGKKHYGGHIERLIGTMMGKVHLLPGTTFRNVKVKGRYDSRNKACLTLPELAKVMVFNIIEYNTSVHRAIDESPVQRWNDGWAKLGGQKAEHKVLDEQKFRIGFLDLITGRINKDGVHWATKRYSAPYLAGFRVGVKYEARVDPMDTRIIFLKTPEGYIPIQRQTPAEYDDRALEDLHRKGKRERSKNPMALTTIAAAQEGAAELLTAAGLRKKAMRADPLAHVPLQSPDEVATKAANDLHKSISLGPGKYVAPARSRTVNRY